MLMKLRQSSPRIEDQGIVGLQNDTIQLVERLLRKDQRRTVVSIVGMGGIGKTTLAKKVYNDRRVVDHFQYCRAWVYVSLDCKPRDIFQRIINQISLSSECEAERTEKLQEDELRDFLHDFLMEKRYLVVFDDLWKSEDWKYVANAFPRESNGSRLLLTTRNKDVALHADPLSVPHTIQLLSANESWKLFCRTAFPGDDPESCPPELRELGEKMVGKCAGLPLAIVVLGGLLSWKKKTPTGWAKALNNIGVHLSGGKDGVDAMLNLSFIDLPPYLKSCFLYFSLFPDDHVISVRKICRLWVAEGFIPQEDGQSMEDMAEDYLNELIDRNLVQMVRMSTNERVRECRIHDLVRDFSIKKAKEERFAEIQQSIASVHSTSSSTKSRRHGIFSDFERYASNKHSTPHLRSLLFFKLDDKSCQVSRLDFVYKCFKLLRVIDFDGVEIGSMPSSFGKLIHLRYLGLSYTGLETLPTSIGNLRSLQTLDARCVKNVPNVIWKMENLRHLLVDGRTDDMPLQIDTLRNLQTLSGIRFKEWGDNNSSKLTALRKLKIQGKFKLERVQFSDSIAKLENLQSLSLDIQSLPSNRFTSKERPLFLTMNSWLHLYKMVMKGPIVRLPAAHEFPPSLTQLTLEGSQIKRDPMPILGNLPKLSTLRLRTGSYHGMIMQVSSSGFLQLKKLQISDLDQLKQIYIEKGGMPRLAQFQIIEVDCSIYGLNHLSHLHEVDVSINASRFPLIDGLEVFPGLPMWVRPLMSSSDWHHTWRYPTLTLPTLTLKILFSTKVLKIIITAELSSK